MLVYLMRKQSEEWEMRTKGQTPPQNVYWFLILLNVSPRRVISELVLILLT